LPLREEVSSLSQDLRRLVREKNDLETGKREREQHLDYLDYQIKEIQSAGLRSGEWEELQAERNILKNAEKIASLVDAGLGRADLEENSVTSGLTRLREIVHELSRYDPVFATYDETLGQSVIAVRELANTLVKFQEKQSLGPERLEELEGRLSVIEKLKRKYGETVDAVLGHLAQIRLERDRLTQSEETLADLEREIGLVFSSYQERARKLSDRRREGARGLESRAEKEIALLGMKKARFRVRAETRDRLSLSPEVARRTGIDEVEFLLSPNPGEELRPLRKIASGGELSRIMLALKTIGREKGSLKTLIFDEIDSGIGGTTAECIAEKLRDLAWGHQVICITHLPQIASFAPHHFRIEKTVAGDRTFTLTKELGFTERVSEIARLLSGSCVTPTALQNAREMLSRNLQEEKNKRKKR
ncbi:MAG: DNA repair protein RecN, partial [Acidobacteriota bacterium]